ncbi:uncharacterized protein LOC135071388 [Ostrinia nubilalis]|uniref:uncharacterized protein LOC135071388 n=1 Tax=Ostrinia nubilalis TaxID=29057 RepID=UPI00308246D6
MILRARPPPPPALSSSSSPRSSSGEEFVTPPDTGASSDEGGPTTPPPPPRPARRGRPPLPARLGSARQPASRTAPATGGVVRRMRWTQTMNENCMRAYYGATEGGTVLTAYRDRILPLFQNLEPTITVSAQRLSDQVRAIQRCKLLDQSVLDRLRLEAMPARTTPLLTSEPPASSSPTVSSSTPQAARVDSGGEEEGLPSSVSYQVSERLRRALEDTIGQYRFTSDSRPRLPRLPTHRRNLALMGALNALLIPYMRTSTNLFDTHSILYCGAIAVCRVAGVQFPDSDRATRPAGMAPAWQIRIERRINAFRTLIAKLICFRRGNNRPRVMRFVAQAFAGTGVLPQDYMTCVTERIDYLKQKVYAWANRIRRYKERVNRYWQNRVFQSDQRKVYRRWEGADQRVSDGQLPDVNTMIDFWRGIWSMPVEHTEGDWMRVIERECESIESMGSIVIDPEDVSSAISTAQNWKSPGPDGLHNFWIKWIRCSHDRLATQFQEALELGSLPAFMTTGVTTLLYKSGSTMDPKNYRPITCLPTIYKLLTSILTTKINTHIVANNILAPAQNGCKLGSRGTKELLLIDMTISQQVRRSRKALSAAWIDYKKAYDSVPHSWLERILELYKVNATLRSFLSSCMGQWTTVLRQPGGSESSPDPLNFIRIERGIFQGDSLSPLWFCLALNPLSTLLKDSGLGYRLRRGGEVISHLLYMDDLKLFAPKRQDLVKLLKTTQVFSNAIRMEFGVDKCAVLHVERGKVVNSPNLQLSETMTLKSLSETETYKYLGMSESLGISVEDIKKSVKERFCSRLTKVLNSLLSGGNKARAFNGWVMPLLIYSFGILRWTQTELDALDRKVRQQLTQHRMLHPRSSVMRLYIPRKWGGRGFLNAKNLHNREVCNLRDYFLTNECGMHRDVVAVDKGLTPLSLANENWRKPKVLSVADRKDVWKSKELHGRFYRTLTGPDVDLLASVNWLRFGDLFGETEGFACAIADEVMMTNNYRKYILKDGTVDICRACHRPGESLRHIISGCSHLANGEYLHRHNLVARIIHQQLALQYGLLESESPYYQYQSVPVLENGHALLYWDRSIITDRTIVCNKPDIVVVDRSQRRAVLVDITIPHDENLVKAEKEKQSKYLDLAHEIAEDRHCLCNLFDVTLLPATSRHVVTHDTVAPRAPTAILNRAHFPPRHVTLRVTHDTALLVASEASGLRRLAKLPAYKH